VPRVALLALTVWAVMANISQRSSPNGSAGSRATIAMSGILFVGVLLLLVALPAAFFRAKIQEARERQQFRKVGMQRGRTQTIMYRNSGLSEHSASLPAACVFRHPIQQAVPKQVETILMRNLSTIKEHEMKRLGLGSMSAGVLSAETGAVMTGVC
jgi:hypothetical protein